MHVIVERSALIREVSMKSGLEGRNNQVRMLWVYNTYFAVSMKSGLEGRNNRTNIKALGKKIMVSMKSGLEGRNNAVL